MNEGNTMGTLIDGGLVEDSLDDSISFVELEGPKVIDVDNLSTTIEDPGYIFEEPLCTLSTKTEVECRSSYKKRPATLPVTFFDISRNIFLLTKCRPLTIRVVDCEVFPWYYKGHERKIKDKNMICTKDESEKTFYSVTADPFTLKCKFSKTSQSTVNLEVDNIGLSLQQSLVNNLIEGNEKQTTHKYPHTHTYTENSWNSNYNLNTVEYISKCPAQEESKINGKLVTNIASNELQYDLEVNKIKLSVEQSLAVLKLSEKIVKEDYTHKAIGKIIDTKTVLKTKEAISRSPEHEKSEFTSKLNEKNELLYKYKAIAETIVRNLEQSQVNCKANDAVSMQPKTKLKRIRKSSSRQGDKLCNNLAGNKGIKKSTSKKKPVKHIPGTEHYNHGLEYCNSNAHIKNSISSNHHILPHFHSKLPEQAFSASNASSLHTSIHPYMSYLRSTAEYRPPLNDAIPTRPMPFECMTNNNAFSMSINENHIKSHYIPKNLASQHNIVKNIPIPSYHPPLKNTNYEYVTDEKYLDPSNYYLKRFAPVANNSVLTSSTDFNSWPYNNSISTNAQENTVHSPNAFNQQIMNRNINVSASNSSSSYSLDKSRESFVYGHHISQYENGYAKNGLQFLNADPSYISSKINSGYNSQHSSLGYHVHCTQSSKDHSCNLPENTNVYYKNPLLTELLNNNKSNGFQKCFLNHNRARSKVSQRAEQNPTMIGKKYDMVTRQSPTYSWSSNNNAHVCERHRDTNIETENNYGKDCRNTISQRTLQFHNLQKTKSQENSNNNGMNRIQDVIKNLTISDILSFNSYPFIEENNNTAIEEISKSGLCNDAEKKIVNNGFNCSASLETENNKNSYITDKYQKKKVNYSHTINNAATKDKSDQQQITTHIHKSQYKMNDPSTTFTLNHQKDVCQQNVISSEAVASEKIVYSPPILPIPTFTKSLEMLVEVKHSSSNSLTIIKKDTGERKENNEICANGNGPDTNIYRKRKVRESVEKNINNKKISLQEYKQRKLENGIIMDCLDIN